MNAHMAQDWGYLKPFIDPNFCINDGEGAAISGRAINEYWDVTVGGCGSANGFNDEN